MSPWFRRKRKETTEQQAPEAPAPAPQPSQAEQSTAPAQAGAATDAATRRRRGNRGGRGRKKPGTVGSAVATAEKADEKPELKPQPAKRERKAPERSQRQERRANQQGNRRRVPQKRAPLPKAKRELLISVDVGEQRVAVLEDDRVAEVYLERPERRSIAGNIYLGVVDNVLPGMEAAFVEIGLEKNGFLYVDEIVVPELEGKRHGKKIQDLISRGQEILVQAVKDPMKTKGARLTTEISLPGRFVVFVPHGEGLGVSRRLEDDERNRLKDIIKKLDAKEGGVIVRTAAEGASAEDVERDLVFLQRLWKTIEARAKRAKAPALVYQEAELPLRVVRDLFTGDFELGDDRPRPHPQADRRLPEEDLAAHGRARAPLQGEDAALRGHRRRRRDPLDAEPARRPSLGRLPRLRLRRGVHRHRRQHGPLRRLALEELRPARLEDTITKNNLEAVKEVVRQLRLRDIGGIIVIDFIDMANPKNRATVEEALRTELERDRTKTYVVEISPLGLVEMTRQNVTDGPREILTKKCPTCAGDGIVVSEASAALEVERRLRALAAGSRAQAFRVEVSPKTASLLLGTGAKRLAEIDEAAKKRFFLVPKEGVHADHVAVLAEGKLVDLQPEAPIAEGAEVEVKLVEVDKHDGGSAAGKVDGIDVVVGGAAKLVGKKAKVRVERVVDGVAYAALVAGDGSARRADHVRERGREAHPRAQPGGKKPSTELEPCEVRGSPTRSDEIGGDRPRSTNSPSPTSARRRSRTSRTRRSRPR